MKIMDGLINPWEKMDVLPILLATDKEENFSTDTTTTTALPTL